MAVRVKFDPSRAAKTVRDEINRATKSNALKEEIGKFITDRVRFQARKGRPLNDNGKFPKLEDSTIANRRRFKGKTSQAFSPAKSNLTITGQLQDAITFVRERAGLFALFVDETARDGSTSSNSDIDKFLREGIKTKDGRIKKYILFTTKGIKKDKKIPRRVKQILLRFLRRQLRRS